MNIGNEDYESDSAIAQLVEYGRQKSIVTIDDILRFFPEAEQDVDQLEEAFSALQSAGIQYSEESGADENEEEDFDLSDIDEEDESGIGLSDDLSNIDTDDTIGLYLKEVSRVPLLTADEEVELAQRIEKGRISREELARVNVTPERRLELRQNIEDSWAARDHLITANSRLVISVAKKYMGRGVPFLDLIQEGNIGLIRATKKVRSQIRAERSAFPSTWGIRSTNFCAISISLHKNSVGIRLWKNWPRHWMFRSKRSKT